MIQVENQYNQLIITIPSGVLDILEVQNFLDYLKYRMIVAKSRATEQDIEDISESINQSWWEKNNANKNKK